jgi:predicted nucleic acid-binding protein
MSGKTFLDTNFLIYSLDAGSDKGTNALHSLDTEPGLMLSKQVIGHTGAAMPSCCACTEKSAG